MTDHPPHADSALDPLRGQFARARRDLAAALIDRDDEIDLALTALVAGEHLLLVGPPGTAKSLLLDAVAALFAGRRFAALLTKFTQPDELVGPVSLRGLKEDRFVRVTAGCLPEADVAFLDEIFKASSAILNTLLKILHERTFDDGSGTARPVPLRLCVAASNEWPSSFLPDPALAATCRDPLRHRFLDALLETPDYRAVHAATTLCEPAAAVAAVLAALAFGVLAAVSKPAVAVVLTALSAGTLTASAVSAAPLVRAVVDVDLDRDPA